MSNTKKSILIYFDNYPMVASLPPEQRGWLLTALMVYGDRLCREGGLKPEEIIEQFPQLSHEARIVCGFMAGNIQRDTQRWLSRQHYRSKSAAGRRQEPASPTPDEKVREDMERVRQLLERSKAEG